MESPYCEAPHCVTFSTWPIFLRNVNSYFVVTGSPLRLREWPDSGRVGNPLYRCLPPSNWTRPTGVQSQTGAGLPAQLAITYRTRWGSRTLIPWFNGWFTQIYSSLDLLKDAFSTKLVIRCRMVWWTVNDDVEGSGVCLKKFRKLQSKVRIAGIQGENRTRYSTNTVQVWYTLENNVR
jgi:hypothetical protein